MNRLWVRIGIAIAIIGMLASGVSAISWWNEQMSSQSSSGCSWDFWGGGCYQQQSQSYSSSSGSYGPGWFGGQYSSFFSSYTRSSWMTSFAANGTQISDVSGVWNTDLLGNVTIRLTGDDIIRAMYVFDDKKGYIQGNFSSNSTPIMDGFWWEEPEYSPPYQAGPIQITFANSTALSGIFAYSDGTWGPFTGMKVRANLTQDEDDQLIDMPKLDWTVDDSQVSDNRVDNPVDTNPISTP